MSLHENAIDPLKLAILVEEGQVFEDWEVSLFERLDRNSSLSIAAFVRLAPRADKRKEPLAFRLVSAIDRRLFGGRGNAPFEGVMARFAHIPRARIEDWSMGSGDVDVALSHLHGPLPPLECEAWEYHFSAGLNASPDAFGFREALEGTPVTRLAVLRKAPDGQQGIACECSTNTKFSAAFNAAYAKGMLPSLVERELLRTARGISGEGLAANDPGSQPEVPRSPGLASSLAYAGKLTWRVLHRMANDALGKLGGRPGDWSLLVSEGDILDSTLDRLTELRQPKGEFRADPFLFRHGGEKYVFFEACDRSSGVGRIDVGRIVGDRIEDVQSLNLGDAHHSYPFVFEHGGQIYMIPETHQRDRVEVWKCERFPHDWSLHSTALEGQSPVDTVLFEWEGQCWLLTNLRAGSFHDHCAELHVFRVDGPDLAKVEPHPLNPVVLDTTSARNGGRPFIRDGKLIRPAQMTSHGLYGYGLKLLEVTRLSMEDYSERELRRIEPRFDQSTTGCHHFDLSHGTFILDARRAYGAKLLGARPIAVRAS